MRVYLNWTGAKHVTVDQQVQRLVYCQIKLWSIDSLDSLDFLQCNYNLIHTILQKPNKVAEYYWRKIRSRFWVWILYFLADLLILSKNSAFKIFLSTCRTGRFCFRRNISFSFHAYFYFCVMRTEFVVQYGSFSLSSYIITWSLACMRKAAAFI